MGELEALTDSSRFARPTGNNPRLRVLHVVTSMNPTAGGVAEAIRRLAVASESLGHDVEVVCLDLPGSEWVRDIPLTIHLLGPGTTSYQYSKALKAWLAENLDRFDTAIVHGLWQHIGLATRGAARRAGKPYFVFPHGMLDPWFKKNYPLKHLKKWLYWPWGEYRVIRDAQGMLFTCEEERWLARESFCLYRCREKVVVLGTNEPPEENREQIEAFNETFPELKGKRIILYLGRLHEKKGCDYLIPAFHRFLQTLSSSEAARWHLMMAGPCAHPDYERLLRERAKRCEDDFPGAVSFPGMLRGNLKWGALRFAELFVLPSHQENFGVAVAEALACSTPVLISDRVNIWREIAAANAGFVEKDNEEGTLRLLQHWNELDEPSKEMMRGQASRCFHENFEIAQSAAAFDRVLQEAGLSEPTSS